MLRLLEGRRNVEDALVTALERLELRIDAIDRRDADQRAINSGYEHQRKAELDKRLTAIETGRTGDRFWLRVVALVAVLALVVAVVGVL